MQQHEMLAAISSGTSFLTDSDIIEIAHDVLYGWWENEAPDYFTEPSTDTECYPGVSMYSVDGCVAVHFLLADNKWQVHAMNEDGDVFMHCEIKPRDAVDFQKLIVCMFEAGVATLYGSC